MGRTPKLGLSRRLQNVSKTWDEKRIENMLEAVEDHQAEFDQATVLRTEIARNLRCAVDE